MFDFLKGEDDAFSILKHDHEVVKGLFEDFEKSENKAQKRKIVADAIMELRLHATIEEEIFYPSLRRKQDVKQDLLNEADEEHHVAKLLIAELSVMDGSEDHWEAKFTVLAENIRHHIKEEEGELFPQARKTGVDFVSIGKQLLIRKDQLKKSGVTASAEEIMISAHKKGSNDSPAIAAKKTSARNGSAKSSPKLVVKRGVSKSAAKSSAHKPAPKKTSGLASKNVAKPAKNSLKAAPKASSKSSLIAKKLSKAAPKTASKSSGKKIVAIKSQQSMAKKSRR